MIIRDKDSAGEVAGATHESVAAEIERQSAYFVGLTRQSLLTLAAAVRALATERQEPAERLSVDMRAVGAQIVTELGLANKTLCVIATHLGTDKPEMLAAIEENVEWFQQETTANTAMMTDAAEAPAVPAATELVALRQLRDACAAIKADLVRHAQQPDELGSCYCDVVFQLDRALELADAEKGGAIE